MHHHAGRARLGIIEHRLRGLEQGGSRLRAAQPTARIGQQQQRGRAEYGLDLGAGCSPEAPLVARRKQPTAQRQQQRRPRRASSATCRACLRPVSTSCATTSATASMAAKVTRYWPSATAKLSVVEQSSS